MSVIPWTNYFENRSILKIMSFPIFFWFWLGLIHFQYPQYAAIKEKQLDPFLDSNNCIEIEFLASMVSGGSRALFWGGKTAKIFESETFFFGQAPKNSKIQFFFQKGDSKILKMTSFFTLTFKNSEKNTIPSPILLNSLERGEFHSPSFPQIHHCTWYEFLILIMECNLQLKRTNYHVSVYQ